MMACNQTDCAQYDSSARLFALPPLKKGATGDLPLLSPQKQIAARFPAPAQRAGALSQTQAFDMQAAAFALLDPPSQKGEDKP